MSTLFVDNRRIAWGNTNAIKRYALNLKKRNGITSDQMEIVFGIV